MKSNSQRSTVLLLAAGLAWASPAFSKEKEVVPTSPPMAKTGVATVFVDTAAEISLQIAGRIVEPLDFLVRKEPKHGRLSGLRRTGRNSAAVLYTPDAHAAPGDDFFSFAAQSLDSPVSAPATVWIRLVERPPVLECPGELDFGKVFLGDTEERGLAIKNAGGGTAAGTIRPNPPWRPAGPGQFRVPAGSESSILLVFEPLEERDFSDRIQIGADPKSVVLVRGSGVAPISWPKDGLVASPADRGKGTASITFTNNSASERTVTVEWPEFLKAVREVTLPAGGFSVVKWEIAAPLSLKYEGAAEVRSGNFKGKLPIRVFPAPAKLEVKPERELKLAAQKSGGPLKGFFAVKNTGGSDTPLEILAPPEILITPTPGNLILRTGQEQAFDVQLESQKKDRCKIRIQSPAGELVELSIEPPTLQTSRPSSPVENFLTIFRKPENSPAPAATVSSGIPPVETLSLLAVRPREIVLAWKLPAPGAAGFRIERRSIAPGANGGVTITWIPWQGSRISISEGMATARLERLPVNAQWTIRIVGLDEKGNPGQPSKSFQIATQPVAQFSVPWWVWLALMPPLAVGLARLRKKNQTRLLAKENERIARLEQK